MTHKLGLVDTILGVAKRRAKAPHLSLVCIESPFRGVGETPEEVLKSVERNKKYAQACMLDAIRRNETPFVGHLLYTQVLDEDDPTQRNLGISLDTNWYHVVDTCAVYTDLGITQGMITGFNFAEHIGVPVVHRSLGGEWKQ